MDPLDTMTLTDWRRVYERTQEYAQRLLDQGVELRRREIELVDRLRRREERVRELEKENQRLRNAKIPHGDCGQYSPWATTGDHSDHAGSAWPNENH